MELPPSQRSVIGRRWQRYQSDIRAWQQTSGVSDSLLENYEVTSNYAVPIPERW
ncbi:MAG: hypothetical protein F6K21_07705 [Symploca sp. SIO2D2]|nr:hypothetical protein [Symploca sp. SIO2D2]